ncbi:uncharacterized protein ACJ7VT_014953 isoform 2-T2 [Polymixia lowei]
MDTVRTEAYLSDAVTCYILDGILLLYCIVITAFFFIVKYPHLPPEVGKDSTSAEGEDVSGGIYQDLKRTAGTDVYQMIEPKGRKQVHKKKKSKANESIQAGGMGKDAYETLSPNDSAPPLAPR